MRHDSRDSRGRFAVVSTDEVLRLYIERYGVPSGHVGTVCRQIDRAVRALASA
jgi:hypothetical protein